MRTDQTGDQPKGILSDIRDFLHERMPKGIGWANALGSSLLGLIVVQIVTGILLSFYYSPNADAAYESVQYIEQKVVFGSIIRGIHHFAASLMVIVLFLHMIRTFIYGAYKRPRQWNWVFGVVLLMLVMGFAFTGYLLPWDMKAYFATKVGINIAGIIPGIGQHLIRILQGGSEMGTITLSRFYSLHVIVLPLLLTLVVGIHLYYIRLHGPTPPGHRDGDAVEYTNRFYPQQLFRDSVLVFAVIAVTLVLAVAFGAPLEEKADPTDTAYIPRPDWYFYGLFQLLKIFEGKLEIVAAVIIPGAFFGLLFVLPWLDRSPERKLSKRPVAASIGGVVVLGIVFLTAIGTYEGRKAKERMAARKDLVTVEGKVQGTFIVDPRIGRQLYDQLKCAGCHSQPSQGENLPPGLEFAGNKYQQKWLIEYLQDPHRIRWQRKDQRPVLRMPDFDLTEEEAVNIATFLMTNVQDSKFPEPEFDWAEADSEMVESGGELVLEFGCTGCHLINDDGQNIGPPLSGVGSKLVETYMFHLIKSPLKVIPNTSMKDFQLEDEDVEDMVAFLRGLK